MVGRDAEGDDLAGRGRVEGLGAEPREFLSVLEDMVGREHGHDRLRIALRRPGGRRADGGGAVAALGLEQNCRLGPDLPQLLGDPEAIVDVGDDD